MSVTPAERIEIGVTARHTAPGTTIKLLVADTGTKPMTVSVLATDAVRVHGKCGIVQKPVGWVTVHSTPTLSLTPRQEKIVNISVHKTGATGAHDLALVVSPVASSSHKGNHVIGAAATQTTVTYPGKNPALTPCKTAAAPVPKQHPQSASADGFIALAVLAALVMAVIAWFMRRRRRNSGSNSGGKHRAA